MKEKKYFLKAWLVNEINYTWRHWAEVWEQWGLGARSYSSDYVDLFTSDFLPNIAQKRCLNFLKCLTLLEGESSSYDQITGLYTSLILSWAEVSPWLVQPLAPHLLPLALAHAILSPGGRQLLDQSSENPVKDPWLHRLPYCLFQ